LKLQSSTQYLPALISCACTAPILGLYLNDIKWQNYETQHRACREVS
jgi:hypothetical protein